MTINAKMLLVLILVALPLFSGCGSTGPLSTDNKPTAPVAKPDLEEFLVASEPVKQEIKKEYLHKKKGSYEYQQMLYLAGDKICNDDSSLCKVFDPMTLKVTFYWMQKELWGMDTVLIGTFNADVNGIPVANQAAVLQTSASGTGFGREQLARAWGVLANAANGTIPMMLQLAKCEGGSCSGSSGGVGNIVIGVSSDSSSQSTSEQTSTANVTGGRPAPKPVAPPSMGVTY